MRHRKSGRKLNRTSSHRLAMFRNMVTSLLEHERIYTTVPKAKEIRRWADSMITLGKRGDLHARRQALAVIRSKAVVHKLFAELAPRYQDRPGGYTRIVKMGYRRGDAAPMCLIELVGGEMQPKPKRSKKKEKVKEVPAEAPAAEESVPAEAPEAESQESADQPEATESGEVKDAESPESVSAPEETKAEESSSDRQPGEEKKEEKTDND